MIQLSSKNPVSGKTAFQKERNKDIGSGAALVAQMVENLPTKQETLDQADPLEKGRATHSSISAWRTPQTEETGRL